MKLTIYSLAGSLLLFILIVMGTISKPYFGFVIILSPIILATLFATILYAVAPYICKKINSTNCIDRYKNKQSYHIPIINILTRNILIFIVSFVILLIIYFLLLVSFYKANHKFIFNSFPFSLLAFYFILHYFYSCRNVKKQVYPNNIPNIKISQEFNDIVIFRHTNNYIKRTKKIIFVELLVMFPLPVFGVMLFIPSISKLTFKLVAMLASGIIPVGYKLFIYYKNKLNIAKNLKITVEDQYINIDNSISKMIKVNVNSIDKVFAFYNAQTNNLEYLEILHGKSGLKNKLTFEGIDKIELLLELIIYQLYKYKLTMVST